MSYMDTPLYGEFTDLRRRRQNASRRLTEEGENVTEETVGEIMQVGHKLGAMKRNVDSLVDDYADLQQQLTMERQHVRKDLGL